MTGSFDAAPRSLVASDAGRARALISGVLDGTPYAARTRELLAAAGRGDPETRALVIERDGVVLALAIFGPIAGTRDGWELSALLIAPGDEAATAGRALVDAVLEAARAARGRFVLAEMPADPVLGTSLTVLRKRGFRQEGRIPDFYRDGVALLFLRRGL